MFLTAERQRFFISSYLADVDNVGHRKSDEFTVWKKHFRILDQGADVINISGLLNPKKLGNFKNQMLRGPLVVREIS